MRLQSGDPLVTKAWHLICDVSRKGVSTCGGLLTGAEYTKIYARLDIHDLEERGESFYHSRMQAFVSRVAEQGLVRHPTARTLLLTIPLALSLKCPSGV